MAARTFEASRTSVSTLPVTCWRTNAVSARSAWVRTASVMPGGTTCSAASVASWRCAIALADVQRELGVGAAADRDDDALEVADAALLDHRDVARRLAQDLVDRGRERRR